MTIKFYAAVLIISSTLVSCAGNDNNDYIDKSLVPANSQNTVIQPGDSSISLSNTPTIPGINSTTSGVQTSPVNLIPQNANAQTGIATGGLNPAHGQPGHRCDIAEGAPLNSKPAQAAVQSPTVNTQQPSPVTITQQPAKTVTAPGMNPAHGEPGHRCDIAVGAPLNSKPPPATVVSTTPPPATTSTTISTTQPVVTQQKTLPGMNPPHGDPGHRCDISVGAPLNSKPAAPAQKATPPPLLTPVKKDSSKS